MLDSFETLFFIQFQSRTWLAGMGALKVGRIGHGPPKNFGWVDHSAFGPTSNWTVIFMFINSQEN